MKNLERRHIKKIVVDNDDEELTVTFEQTVGHHPVTREPITVETTEHLSTRDIPEVTKALGPVVDRLIETIQERKHVIRGEVKCGTCSGRCCNRVYEYVALYQEDIDRLLTQLSEREVEERVRWLNPKHTPDWNGVVAHLGTIDFDVPGEPEEKKACVFLGLDYKCSIYKIRPQVCRDYSGWDCSEHKEKPEMPPRRGRLPILFD